MVQVNPDCFVLSASSISAFKACPTRFRLGYREGLRTSEDTDSQRTGTNWHALHETFANSGNDMDAVVALLNERYESIPLSKTPEEWEVERQVLLTCFIGYQWYYGEDPIEVIESELAFELPLHMPTTGLPLPLKEVKRHGKIDHLIVWHGMVGPLERKSTASKIEEGSPYWERSQKDTQVSMYALACRDMAKARLMPDSVLTHAMFDPTRFGNTLYDVWHKPTIRPSKLTQAETEAFVTTGDYCDVHFEVLLTNTPNTLTVDGWSTEIFPGAKEGKYAIKETPGMFAARLLKDIQERPTFYFIRKEIPRTDQDLSKFRVALYNIYQSQKSQSKTGHWYDNEAQCRATFPCPYIPVCYGPGADRVCAEGLTPNGFRRIFTPLTIQEKTFEE